MQQCQREIIFLKPTSALLSFLAEQLPNVTLPDLNAIQSDTTAYTIPVHQTDDALLDTIERHFSYMFQYEIERWLGAKATLDIKATFLDFLCCFKFEIHSNIVLLEPSMHDGKQLLRVKPRALLLKKMQEILDSNLSEHDDDGDQDVLVIDQIKLAHLTENATVVIKNFEQVDEIKPFVQQFYRPIFKLEMMRMCEHREQWPKMLSFDDFSRYFLVDVHTNIIHLG
jgi:hypothetical protein